MFEPTRPGVRACLQCGWLFVSPDVSRLRRCQDCKDEDDDDNYMPRHVVSVAQMRQSARERQPAGPADLE